MNLEYWVNLVIDTITAFAVMFISAISGYGNDISFLTFIIVFSYCRLESELAKLIEEVKK